MLLTGKEDLRVVKTIEGIKTAFEELICEKEYEKITVKELCDRARINKKTFYHYYPTLDDLLAEMQMEISSEYIEKIKDFKWPEDIDKVNREFFLFSAAQSPAYEKITCSGGSYGYIRQKMASNVMAETWDKSPAFNSLAPLNKSIIGVFLNAITVELYKQWVADGKKVPVEQMIDLANKLTHEGIHALIK